MTKSRFINPCPDSTVDIVELTFGVTTGFKFRRMHEQTLANVIAWN